MPPRLNLVGASRSLTIRSRPLTVTCRSRAVQVTLIARRGYADEKSPGGPNESGIGHVSEEAVDYADVLGGTKPDLEQGTPVQEVYTAVP
jgi:small subunit ribosomal protein S7